MDSLRIEVAENGFVVYAGSARDHDMIGKTWAFESAETLAAFVLKWGDGQTEATGPENGAKGI